MLTAGLRASPVLHTRRLMLRAPAARDCDAFCAFMASDRARFIGGTAEPGRAWRAFGTILGHWIMRGFGLFVITGKSTDEAIGMAGPWFPESWPEREIGWSLWRAGDEGEGLAAEAAAITRDFAFARLGWDTAVSYIDLDNARSIALAERLGAVRDMDAATPPGHPDGGMIGVWRHPNPNPNPATGARV